MSYKISKELFEAVMELKVAKIVVSNHMGDENRIHYSIMGREFSGSILINAFLFKCKKWALSKGYELHSYTHYDDSISYINVWHWDSLHKDVSDIQLKDNTEPEAIFKACQWILKNKDKQ